jgi:hypothetical protein
VTNLASIHTKIVQVSTLTCTSPPCTSFLVSLEQAVRQAKSSKQVLPGSAGRSRGAADGAHRTRDNHNERRTTALPDNERRTTALQRLKLLPLLHTRAGYADSCDLHSCLAVVLGCR